MRKGEIGEGSESARVSFFWVEGGGKGKKKISENQNGEKGRENKRRKKKKEKSEFSKGAELIGS